MGYLSFESEQVRALAEYFRRKCPAKFERAVKSLTRNPDGLEYLLRYDEPSESLLGKIVKLDKEGRNNLECGRLQGDSSLALEGAIQKIVAATAYFNLGMYIDAAYSMHRVEINSPSDLYDYVDNTFLSVTVAECYLKLASFMDMTPAQRKKSEKLRFIYDANHERFERNGGKAGALKQVGVNYCKAADAILHIGMFEGQEPDLARIANALTKSGDAYAAAQISPLMETPYSDVMRSYLALIGEERRFTDYRGFRDFLVAR